MSRQRTNGSVPAGAQPDATDLDDLLAAAIVAPFAAPAVLSLWALVHALAHPSSLGRSVFADFTAAVTALTFFSIFTLPVGYVMMFGLGLPAVLLWRRIRGGISGPTTVLLGAGLAVSPVLLPAGLHASIRAVVDSGLWLFACCGAATAAVFWHIGLRDARGDAAAARDSAAERPVFLTAECR